MATNIVYLKDRTPISLYSEKDLSKLEQFVATEDFEREVNIIQCTLTLGQGNEDELVEMSQHMFASIPWHLIIADEYLAVGAKIGGNGFEFYAWDYNEPNLEDWMNIPIYGFFFNIRLINKCNDKETFEERIKSWRERPEIEYDSDNKIMQIKKEWKKDLIPNINFYKSLSS